MSNSRIEIFFQKIQNINDRLDSLYLERKSINEKLSEYHAKADELNTSKRTYYAFSSSLTREISNYYKRINSLSEWSKNVQYPNSKEIASKSIFSIKQNIATLKAKKIAYEEKIAHIQEELDSTFKLITKLNIQKSDCNTEIRRLRQKKDEYKRSIDSLKYNKKRC